ncbi:glycosyltransferase family A protein [Amaricoccus sp. W119]|uniref:glycosyltransferase family A protein n=1 Tax=Amaricoccus sp. W119 TaxID=3391833 RepID=UPI0039A4EA4F
MKHPRITISLTSISGRLPSLAATLGSLLGQDYPDFLIRLYLSHEPFLLDEGVRVPPPDLEALATADDRIEIRFVPNIGPYRKILPFLAETAGRRCLVATADDDTIYPADWLSGLYRAFREHHCVVCYRGHFMRREGTRFAPYRNWMRNAVPRNPDLFNLPTGKDGVLYDTAQFHPDVLDHATALRLAPTADDLWLKWHYSATGKIATYIINDDYRTLTFEHADADGGLYRNFNKDGGNDATILNLERHFKTSFGGTFASQ